MIEIDLDDLAETELDDEEVEAKIAAALAYIRLQAPCVDSFTGDAYTVARQLVIDGLNSLLSFDYGAAGEFSAVGPFSFKDKEQPDESTIFPESFMRKLRGMCKKKSQFGVLSVGDKTFSRSWSDDLWETIEVWKL